jgi:hypothetical protein
VHVDGLYSDWAVESEKSRNAYILFYDRVQPIASKYQESGRALLPVGREKLAPVGSENVHFLKQCLFLHEDYLDLVTELLKVSSGAVQQQEGQKYTRDLSFDQD